MKKLIVIASLFVFVFLNAANYGPSGTDVRIANITNRIEVLDQIEGYPETEKIEELIEVEEIKDNETPSIYSPLWADDLLVTDQCNIDLRYNIAFDYDANGYLYAAIQSSHTGTSSNDTMFIYQSTDKGYTWNEFYCLWVGSGGKLLDFEIRLQPQVTVDPAIYIAWVDSTYTTGNRMYFGVVHPGGAEYWNNITPAAPPIEVAMDISSDSVPFIVLGYITQVSATETSWYTTVSADTGATWSNYSHNSTNGPEEVTVACLDNIHFYSGAIYTKSSYRFRVFRYYGGYTYENASGTNSVIRHDPCLATQKYHAYPSNFVYGIYSEGSDTAERVYFNYSSDGAQNWGIPDFWGPVGDVWAKEPYIRIGWNTTIDRITGNCVVPYIYGNDSLIVSITGPDFQTWDLRTVQNDYNVTGAMPAQSMPIIGFGINGRVFIYREWGSDNIWFDRWNYQLDVEEEIPSLITEVDNFNVISNNERIRIDFSVVNDENIKIEVYDFSGRSVNTLIDTKITFGDYQIVWDLNDNFGQKVQAGTYFINLISDNINNTKKVSIF